MGWSSGPAYSTAFSTSPNPGEGGAGPHSERASRTNDAPAQDDLAGAIRIEPQPGQLPVAVLGVIGQEAPRGSSGRTARQDEMLKLELRHHPRHIATSNVASVTSGQPPTPSPNPDDVREAAEALKAAIDAHLAACEQRSAEVDFDVQRTYGVLRTAAERYDDLLFTVYEEVTPWEFAEGPETETEYEDVFAEPERMALLLRRDYLLIDSDALLAAGRAAYSELYPNEPAEAAESDVSHPGRAVYQLLHAYGIDGLDARAGEAGLFPEGGTVWVQGLHPDDETLEDDPFGVADEDLLIYRLDEVYGEPDEH